MDDKRSNDASAVMVRADGKVMEKSQLYTSELRIRKPRREMEAAGGKKNKKWTDERKKYCKSESDGWRGTEERREAESQGA